MKIRQDTLGFLLADVSRLMRRDFQRRLDGSSLTMAKARALVYVSRHEGVRQIDLAEMLEVQPITLARLIDQLAEAGLVERRASPTDRRAYHVFLLPAATQHLATIEEVANAVRGDALKGLTDQQAAEIISALRKIRNNLAPR
jgi:DNA-binding MarR family transcriptional regulator